MILGRGDAAVRSLIECLQHSDNIANHAAHALGEAVRSPSQMAAAVQALVDTMSKAANRITADSGTIERILPPAMAERFGVDRLPVLQVSILRIFSVAIRALLFAGCLVIADQHVPHRMC